MKRMAISALAAGIAAGFAFTASAAEVNLPKNLAWTAYGSNTSGYAQSVGLGNMLKGKYGTELRIIPGNNDVSRMLPLKAGQADLCACGIAGYFAQEGVMMFAAPNLGPQRIVNLFNNIGRNGQQLVAAADAGIKQLSDIKGKRVTWVRGAPALNTNAEGMLAFAGLTWDDVVKVEVPGFGQSADAVINGQADMTWGSTVTTAYNQLAASPRGLLWLHLPHDDKEAWARARAVAPHWAPTMISNAVAVEQNTQGKVPYEGNNYPYPIFIGYQTVTNDLAYGLTKAVMENYEMFKESGPGMDGYQLSAQNLNYIMPYHPGAIAYYKEVGLWNDETQATTDSLLKRQDVLAAAWETFLKDAPSGDDFAPAWSKARAAALEAEGMPVPFRE